MILVRSERDELAVPDLVARCGAQLVFFECKVSRPSEPSELWSKRLAEACQRLTERMSPWLIRAAAYADGVLLVEFRDGLRRALTWSDLPFARQTPQLDPQQLVSARTSMLLSLMTQWEASSTLTVSRFAR